MTFKLVEGWPNFILDFEGSDAKNKVQAYVGNQDINQTIVQTRWGERERLNTRSRLRARGFAKIQSFGLRGTKREI